jgi:hypothetical protein
VPLTTREERVPHRPCRQPYPRKAQIFTALPFLRTRGCGHLHSGGVNIDPTLFQNSMRFGHETFLRYPPELKPVQPHPGMLEAALTSE